MSQFQSMFDVDTDAMRAASFDSVFDNSEEAAKNFDSIFGAEEDDRLMEAVIGFAEDGTDLPDGTELHNNEEDDLGDDGVTPKNFGDGIFNDETDNAPKRDTSDNTNVIDRTKGAEGTKDVTDVDCPKAGVQDGGQDKAAIDPEHIDDASAKETQTAEKGYDFHQENAWVDDILGEDADLDIEGTDKDVVDIKDGVQDNGNADHLDDDQVEHLEDESEKETQKAADSYEETVEDLFGLNEESDTDLGDPDTCTNVCNDLGMPNDKDGEGGLPDKKPGEGEVKDANAEFQDDLDEVAGILSEDTDDLDDEDDSDEDEASPDADDDVEGATSEDVPDENDDIDFSDDDLDDDSEDVEECGGSSVDDDQKPVKEDSNDQQEDGQQSDQVAKEEQEKEKDSDSVDEAFLFEDDQIDDELNDVVDDQDRRDGYETAVDHYEGEEAPAEDLDESVASILREADTDDSDVDEAIDDDAIQTVEDNDASGEGSLNLDYDASDDEIFDDVNED